MLLIKIYPDNAAKNKKMLLIKTYPDDAAKNKKMLLIKTYPDNAAKKNQRDTPHFTYSIFDSGKKVKIKNIR